MLCQSNGLFVYSIYPVSSLMWLANFNREVPSMQQFSSRVKSFTCKFHVIASSGVQNRVAQVLVQSSGWDRVTAGLLVFLGTYRAECQVSQRLTHKHYFNGIYLGFGKNMLSAGATGCSLGSVLVRLCPHSYHLTLWNKFYHTLLNFCGSCGINYEVNEGVR